MNSNVEIPVMFKHDHKWEVLSEDNNTTRGVAVLWCPCGCVGKRVTKQLSVQHSRSTIKIMRVPNKVQFNQLISWLSQSNKDMKPCQKKKSIFSLLSRN